MKFAARHKPVAWLLPLVLAAACRDKLISPVDCPALCPGGSVQVLDTTITALPGQDSSLSGYQAPGLGPSLLASNGLPAEEDRILVRFLARPDSVLVSDTNRAYTIDSVAIGVTLQARDTTLTGLKLVLYRLPVDIDSTTTFAGVDTNLVDANLIDTISIGDSTRSGLVRAVLTDSALMRVVIPPGDSGHLAIGIAVSAPRPTGVRVASLAATGAPVFTTYVTADVPDSSKRLQVLNRLPQYASFVTQALMTPDPDLLTVGGAPSSRAWIRFDLPALIRDSADILRATLELTTDAPVPGLVSDAPFLNIFGVLGDLGSKSPLLTSSTIARRIQLPDSTSGVVSVDITAMVRTWQRRGGLLPQMVFLVLTPEAASFSEPVFRSTRSPSGAPRIRLTYNFQYPFVRP